MKKLKTKLTETRACPSHKDVVDTICFVLICGALGWVAVKYRYCKELLDAVKTNYKNAEDLNKLLLEENALLEEAYQTNKSSVNHIEDLIKRGVVIVDGEWYKTEKKDSYEECLK